MTRTLAGFLAILLAGSALAQDDRSKDESAIRKSVDSYVAAFNKADAEAIAEHWSEGGEYVNRTTGERVRGKEQIKQMMVDTFADGEGTQLAVEVSSIRFITKDVAMEEGTARIMTAGELPEETTYSAIHVRAGDAWKLDSVRETVLPMAPSHYEHLKALEWMVGEWVNGDDQSTVETTCQWTKNRNFLVKQFSVKVDGQMDLSGTQIIGWDASSESIRSWFFDSDGGFGSGSWIDEGNGRWMIKAGGTLPDGRKASAVHILSYQDEDNYTWQSVGRAVDGELLPNVNEFPIVRK